jgi:hypothetical protein
MFEVKEKELLGKEFVIKHAYNDMCAEQKKKCWRRTMDATEGSMSGRIKIGKHSKRKKEGVRIGGVQQHT